MSTTLTVQLCMYVAALAQQALTASLAHTLAPPSFLASAVYGALV